MNNIIKKVLTAISVFILIAIGIEKFSKLQFAKHTEGKRNTNPKDE